MGASLYAQSPLPDPLPESPSAAHQYYENQGQIIDELGLLHPEIKYYTNDASPQLYLADERISFVSWAQGDTSSQDTSYRIDLVFPECIQEGEGCPTIVTEEAGNDHLNYYLAHCPAGITDVGGHNRIIYKNVDDYTDMHFYSNAAGLKSYIVFHPGADPTSFYLHFQGQDSIQVLSGGGGGIDMYLGPWDLVFPQATAYAIDPSGQTYSLPWLPVWVHNGLGEIGVSLGTYDPTHTLVLRMGGVKGAKANQNLTWSTYYGAGDDAFAKGVAVNKQDEVFHIMHIAGNSFTFRVGEQIINNGGEDVVLSRFDRGAVREWGTFFGGDGNEIPEDIALSGASVFVAGHVVDGVGASPFPRLQSGNGFYQSTNNGGSDAFLLEVKQSDGTRNWATYFGGSGYDKAYSIDVNAAANMLVIGGTTFSLGTLSCSARTDFPLCNKPSAYFQSSNQGKGDGFVAQFDLGSKKLLWSTFFGGKEREQAYDVLIANPGANGKAPIYLCGLTETSLVPSNTTPPLSPPSNGAFPLTAAPAAYFQTFSGNSYWRAFISRFDSGRKLQWSSYFGGGDLGSSTEFHRMAVNSSRDVYVVGNADLANGLTVSSCTANSTGNLPICNQNGISDTWQPAGWVDALITRFDKSDKLLWSTLYGSDIWDCAVFEEGTRVALGSRDKLYITGSNGFGGNGFPMTQAIPTLDPGSVYFQNSNASIPLSTPSARLSTDPFLVMFDQKNKRKWATHFGGGCRCSAGNRQQDFGGDGSEIPTGLALFKDERLYITGLSHSPATPNECPPSTTGPPFCNPNSAAGRNSSAFISRFELAPLTTSIDKNIIINTLIVFPNPVQGKLNIQLPKSIRGKAQIQLFDQVGRELRQENHQANTAALQIDVSELGSGVYYLILASNDQRYVAKWIK